MPASLVREIGRPDCLTSKCALPKTSVEMTAGAVGVAVAAGVVARCPARVS
jgi:hypothetical protein